MTAALPSSATTASQTGRGGLEDVVEVRALVEGFDDLVDDRERREESATATADDFIAAIEVGGGDVLEGGELLGDVREKVGEAGAAFHTSPAPDLIRGLAAFSAHREARKPSPVSSTGRREEAYCRDSESTPAPVPDRHLAIVL